MDHLAREEDEIESLEAISALEDKTPYQLTLAGAIAPVGIHVAFNLFAGLSLSMIAGAPLAAAWALAGLAADLVLRRLYIRWNATAAQTPSPAGLLRLSFCAAARSSLWISAPAFVALTTREPGAYAYVAVTALSLVAVAASTGWISRGVWIGYAAPAVLAIVLQAAPYLDPLGAAGLGMAVLSFAATAVFISIATEKSLAEWSRANQRTRNVLARLKQALARSEAAERRLRIAADIAELHVFELDYRSRTLVSLGAEQAFFDAPLTFADVAADPFVIVAPEDRAAVREAWARHRRGDGPYRAEYRVRRADGREVWALAAAEMIRDETGRPQSFVGAALNITERKRAELELVAARERAEAGSRAKSEFLATMSHEIRTPLNGVLGMAQAMARDELKPEQRTRLNVIRECGESLLQLLNGILDLSRIEAGRLELEDGPLDLAAIVRAACAAFVPIAADKGLAMVCEIAPEAQGVFRGDETRVRQILANLLANALKFTERGVVTVALRCDGPNLVMSVADTGIGVDSGKLPALFDKFVQADASTTRRFGGSGLGLAICKQLAELMGGSIEVESRPGAGSTFTVRLPLPRMDAVELPAKPEPAAAPAARAAPRKRPAPAARKADAGPGLRVLAAEDNAVNRRVLSVLMAQAGLDLSVVVDGRQALEAWRAQEWDLVLMDIQMPVMDGLAATCAIREEEALTGRRRTPIIAVTANVMSHQVQAYRAAGMDEVVAKPVEFAELMRAMKAALDGAEAEKGRKAPRARRRSRPQQQQQR